MWRIPWIRHQIMIIIRKPNHKIPLFLICIILHSSTSTYFSSTIPRRSLAIINYIPYVFSGRLSKGIELRFRSVGVMRVCNISPWLHLHIRILRRRWHRIKGYQKQISLFAIVGAATKEGIVKDMDDGIEEGSDVKNCIFREIFELGWGKLGWCRMWNEGRKEGGVKRHPLELDSVVRVRLDWKRRRFKNGLRIRSCDLCVWWGISWLRCDLVIYGTTVLSKLAFCTKWKGIL